jgi:biotin carboxylase
MCNLNNFDDIRSTIDNLIMQRLEISAIVSFIDPYCHTASLLSREYGLKYFSSNAISAMLDKTKTREALAETPYSLSYHIAEDSADAPNFNPAQALPLILKSPLSTGSKDVRLASTAEQYKTGLNQLRKKYPNAPVLIESFLDGPQYLVETLTIGGRVNIVAIIEQEITFSGRFIVTGYKMVLEDNEFFGSLKKAAKSIVSALGMEEGPCHLELRHSGRQWRLIEANPRISGGAMNLLIETSFGLNLAKETLKCALGLPADMDYKHRKETFLQYIVVPRGGALLKVTGKNAAQNSPEVVRVYVKPKRGSMLVPPVSMSHRYAYVMATGASGEDAKQNAKTAASKIRFHLLNTGERPVENSESLNSFCENIVFLN